MRARASVAPLVDEELRTQRLLLRPPREEDAAPLAERLSEPEVARWWPDHDAERVRRSLLAPLPELAVWVIEYAGTVAGLIQAHEHRDPDCRHAGLELFLGRAWQGRGLAQEAITAVAHHLVVRRGHHRLVIDPAADNVRAIRAYAAVGFRPVGVLRQYERGIDGRWHDGLLMELLASDVSGALLRAHA